MAAISLPPQQPVATATAGSSPICAARPVLMVMLPPFCGVAVVTGATVVVAAALAAWVVVGDPLLESPHAMATRPRAKNATAPRMTDRDRAILPPLSGSRREPEPAIPAINYIIEDNRRQLGRGRFCDPAGRVRSPLVPCYPATLCCNTALDRLSAS